MLEDEKWAMHNRLKYEALKQDRENKRAFFSSLKVNQREKVISIRAFERCHQLCTTSRGLLDVEEDQGQEQN